MAIIQTVNLVKKYKDLTAVGGVNLEIMANECFGLLGPNGAGKTTLIRMLTAVSPSTSGEIRVMGRDLKTNAREIKMSMGVAPQIDNLDPDLTVLKNLLVFARYFDINGAEARRRALELLKLFELQGKQDADIRALSGGMKRRLLLARGLINSPKILILDEPTTGLDPQSRYLVWNKLTELKTQGVTLLLCTQNMEEAQVLCDRVAVMNQGKILVVDQPVELIKKYVGREVGEIIINHFDKAEITGKLKDYGLDFEEVWGKINIFHVDSKAEVLEKLSIRRRPGTLEDVFFRLTGRSLSE